MKKAKFIINAYSVKEEVLKFTESVIGCLSMNRIVNKVDVVYTHKPQDATAEAAKMVKGEYDFVTVVGGDGTVHDVINGVLLSGNETPIAVIMAGTANNFANFLQLKNSKASFCKMIKDFQTIEADVGKINQQYFVNTAGYGVGVSAYADTPMENKAVFGKLAYFMEGVASASKNRDKTVRLRYQSKEFSGTMDTALFIIRNAGNFFGTKEKNGRKLLQDGYLDVLIVERRQLLKLPGFILRLGQGERMNYPGVKYFQTKALDIEMEDGEELNIDFDKERFGHLPVHIEAVSKAVKILVPKEG